MMEIFLAQANITDIGNALNKLPPGTANFWSAGLNALLNNVAQTFLIAATVVSLFFLLIGGIKWATAGGDKEAVTSAQKTVTSALIGLVIVFSAWAILNLVNFFFGISGKGVGGPGPNCDPPAGKIGWDGGGGCCGSFTSKQGKTCDSGGCRAWEQCTVANPACASGTSCCIKRGSDATCSWNSDCCSGSCNPSTKKCNP